VVGGDVAAWRRTHLPPFVAAISAGVRSVMTAHVRYPALDDAPATVSRAILVDLLRDELGFDGVVITDALEMAAIAARFGMAGGAVAALAAGADALCLGARGGEALYTRVRAAVVEAVRAGDLPMARVAQAAERVERLRAWTASAVPVGLSPGHDDPGLDVARRVALARGVPPLHGRPVLIELRAAPNLAVGAAAWDLVAPLTERGYAPLLTARVTGAADGLDAVLAGSVGHPIVVVGRDVARHPWQREVWDAVRAARPGSVLVDLGLPRPADLGAGPYVLVGGAARPNLRVAAEVLVAGG
jgi:beta-N-acetylhexosaminidase